MANITKIDYKGKGFWIGEAEMEIIFYFILKTFKRLNPDVEFRKKIEDDLEQLASGGQYGYMVIIWDEDLKTEQEEQQMTAILQETILDLESFGDYISVKVLQEAAAYNPQKEYRTSYNKPLKTIYVTEVVKALVHMLKGEWEHEDYNLAFDHYW